MSSYVLVADSNGEVEILQVSYETKWKDLCVMVSFIDCNYLIHMQKEPKAVLNNVVLFSTNQSIPNV